MSSNVLFIDTSVDWNCPASPPARRIAPLQASIVSMLAPVCFDRLSSWWVSSDAIFIEAKTAPMETSEVAATPHFFTIRSNESPSLSTDAVDLFADFSTPSVSWVASSVPFLRPLVSASKIVTNLVSVDIQLFSLRVHEHATRYSAERQRFPTSSSHLRANKSFLIRGGLLDLLRWGYRRDRQYFGNPLTGFRRKIFQDSRDPSIEKKTKVVLVNSPL